MRGYCKQIIRDEPSCTVMCPSFDNRVVDSLGPRVSSAQLQCALCAIHRPKMYLSRRDDPQRAGTIPELLGDDSLIYKSQGLGN